MTELAWGGASQAELLALAARIKPMVASGKTVKEAVDLVVMAPTSSNGAADWATVADISSAR